LFAGCLVVIAFDEVDRFTRKPFAVGDYLLFSTHAEIPQEIEDIVGFYAGIYPFSDYIIHLARTHKRAVTVPDDIEMAEMKIGCEPNVIHDNAE